MSHMLRSSVSLLVLGLLFGPAPAECQDTPNDQDSEARGLFLAGEAAFEGGRFEEALEHFERAHELSGRPELLYNIGTTAERLRIDARAIEAYERYLEEIPESPMRANVEGRLRLLREQVERRRTERAEHETADAASEPSEGVDPQDEQSSSSALGWGLAAGGFGLLAGGALAFGLAAASRDAATDVDPGTPWVDVAADADRADRRTGFGIGLLAAGAVLATVGLVLVASAGDEDEEVALRIGPASLSLTGSF